MKKDYCPKCGHPLHIDMDVQPEATYIVVKDTTGHVITNCPECLIELDVRYGMVVEASV